MSKIRSKNTIPELLTRKALWKMGYRYRIHYKELSGSPDIVITKNKTVIFVHGCFWHRHAGCNEASRPKTNSEFWEAKIKANVIRDKKNISAIKKLGWQVIIVWECELSNNINNNIEVLKNKLNI